MWRGGLCRLMNDLLQIWFDFDSEYTKYARNFTEPVHFVQFVSARFTQERIAFICENKLGKRPNLPDVQFRSAKIYKYYFRLSKMSLQSHT